MFAKIKKWLEEMAERNEERYGKEPLNCCGLNDRKQAGREQKDSETNTPQPVKNKS